MFLCVCVCVYTSAYAHRPTYINTYLYIIYKPTYTHTNSVRTYKQTSFYPSYSLTPCTRVFLEKLIDSKLVKKFPSFYGTQKFITAFTSARHLSLSSARSIQSIPSHPNSLRSIFGLPKCQSSSEARVCFVTKPVFKARNCQHLAQPPRWRTYPCQLSATAYSVYTSIRS